MGYVTPILHLAVLEGHCLNIGEAKIKELP